MIRRTRGPSVLETKPFQRLSRRLCPQVVLIYLCIYLFKYFISLFFFCPLYSLFFFGHNCFHSQCSKRFQTLEDITFELDRFGGHFSFGGLSFRRSHSGSSCELERPRKAS